MVDRVIQLAGIFYQYLYNFAAYFTFYFIKSFIASIMQNHFAGKSFIANGCNTVCRGASLMGKKYQSWALLLLNFRLWFCGGL